MKTKLALLIAIFAFMFSCTTENTTTQRSEITDHTTVSAASSEVKINIQENGSWSANSSESWCQVPTSQKSGHGPATLKVSIEKNTSTSARKATVTVYGESVIITAVINQEAGKEESTSREITVIFHTIYDGTDKKQELSEERVAEIMEYVNKKYSQTDNNMDISFSLATTDPSGNTLSEKGISRIKVSNATIDAEKFMSDMESTYVKDHLWDPNKYINIYTYDFKGDVALGISFMPYCLKADPIGGLIEGDFFLNNEITYLHGVHLNTKYSDVDTAEDADPFKDKTYDADFKVTAAHEIGHYLGLFHPFTETSEESCAGNDYCDDTPNYDRAAYNKYQQETTFTSIDQLFVRTACDGAEFTATNIMDYGFNWYKGFSQDQNKRVNSVLDRALLVPGYKAHLSKATKGATTRPEPQMVICAPTRGSDHVCDNHNH